MTIFNDIILKHRFFRVFGIAWMKLGAKRFGNTFNKTKKAVVESNDGEEEENAEDVVKLNEKLVFLNIMFEAGKSESEESMNDRMLRNVLLHGQMIV
jgi:hypothetical protein